MHVRREAELSDAELVEAARSASGSGDLRAFDELVVRYQERVAGNCRFLTNSPSDAADLAQEVFVKAYFGLKGFEGRATFRTWLERIKANHCINHVRSRSHVTFLDIDDEAVQAAPQLRTSPAAERALAARDERERVAAVLHGLSDQIRVPLVLRDMDGLPYQEIADRLGIGLSAVKMRIKRGREAFRRDYLAAQAGQPGSAAEPAPAPDLLPDGVAW